ncbi:MAG: DUF3291 domain-containing protein [Rhizobiales bacterium]|nr:DUF3291 domain-containing protein [Hyphomicrobiales bacterium]MBI3674019.1 DUF3291 domain-containing protein [Hyphomicrobiales bacterium]
MTGILAQINVGRLRYDLDDPRLAGFIGNLDRINALAEASEGFLWRLKDSSGNATAIRAYDDPRIAVNMSAWASLEALQRFAYRSEHLNFFRRRSEWFEAFAAPFLALWWIEAGRWPSAAEGRARLEHLATHGPTPHAFTFRDRFT